MTRVKWTEEMKRELLEAEGEGIKLFAEKYGLAFSNVDRKRRKLQEKEVKEVKSYQEIAEKKDLNTLMNERNLFAQIGEVFVASATKLPAPKLPEQINVSDCFDEEEMVFLFSDSQIGEVVNPNENGGLSAYSTQIFKERLEFLKHSLGKIIKIHKREVPYNRINVFFLGDIIEGSTIFRGQLRSIDINTVEQVMCAVDKLTYFVAWLATQFTEVGCYCVVGNHGRIGNFGENSPLDNLDYLVYKWMEERLSNYPNVKFNVADTWWMTVERQNTKFTLVHGDDIKAWMNIPFYGADRSETRMQRLTRHNFDYYVLGHHHTKAEFGNIIMNGCWPGGSEFSLKRMQVGGVPTQKLFSVHKDFGVTWSRNIQLVNPKEIKLPKIYN